MVENMESYTSIFLTIFSRDICYFLLVSPDHVAFQNGCCLKKEFGSRWAAF